MAEEDTDSEETDASSEEEHADTDGQGSDTQSDKTSGNTEGEEKDGIAIGLSKRTVLSVTVAAAIIVVLAIVMLQQSGDSQPAPLATVNGQAITEADLASGPNVSRSRAVREAVVTTLLRQKAAEDGQTVTEDEAENRLKRRLAQQNQTLRSYKQRLSQRGISYQERIQTYREQVGIQRYLSTQIDNESLTVSEEEIRQAYNQTVQRMPSERRPSYESVKPTLRRQIRQRKMQRATRSVIQRLSESANITVEGDQTFSLTQSQ